MNVWVQWGPGQIKTDKRKEKVELVKLKYSNTACNETTWRAQTRLQHTLLHRKHVTLSSLVVSGDWHNENWSTQRESETCQAQIMSLMNQLYRAIIPPQLTHSLIQSNIMMPCFTVLGPVQAQRRYQYIVNVWVQWGPGRIKTDKRKEKVKLVKLEYCV